MEKEHIVHEGVAGGVWTLTAALAAPAGHRPLCSHFPLARATAAVRRLCTPLRAAR
uniref:Uncharacterized protein n=1 Tax=Triticum urartu TaxID=4572 RepID=A0A8R7U4U3_TRIUA